MRDNLDAFEALNTKIIGISVDAPLKCLEFSENLNLPFPLLSDEKRLVIEEFRASDTVEKDGKIIAKSVNIVFKKGGDIVYRHVSEYRHRNSVEEIIEILKTI